MVVSLFMQVFWCARKLDKLVIKAPIYSCVNPVRIWRN